MQAERESTGGCANPTIGIIRPSPSGKSVRSKSGTYPQSRSGLLIELGVNKGPPSVLFFSVYQRYRDQSAIVSRATGPKHIEYILFMATLYSVAVAIAPPSR
jgi:hypothetical protein